MKTVFLDFECFFSKDLTLKKMTIDEYVKHPDFKIHGVSIKVDDGPIRWYKGKDSVKALKVCKGNAVVCQNAYFDLFILNYWYKIKPAFIYDTMLLARALYGPDKSASLKSIAETLGIGHKDTLRLLELEGVRDLSPDQEAVFVEEYAKPDVQMMYDAFQIMRPKFPQSELDLIDVTVRMFTEPVLLLNEEVLQENLEDVQQTKRDKLLKVDWILNHYSEEIKFIGEYDPYESVRSILASNDKFAGLLRTLGIEPPMKKSPATGERTYAFSKKDKGFIQLLEHPDEKIKALAEARLEAKSTIEETRTQTYLSAAKEPFAIPLLYYGARTGRMAGGSGEKKKGGRNLQNLGRNSKLRNAIEAPDGYVIVACDSSQIEARGIATVAEQWDLVEAFAKGEDIYSMFATDLYGFEVSKKNKVERYVGKTCILGLGYGMGAAKLQWTLQTGQIPVIYEEGRCKEIVQFYRQKYPQIPELWYEMQDCLGYIFRGDKKDYGFFSVDKEGIRLPTGLYIRYPQLRLSDRKEFEYYGKEMGKLGWTKIYGGKVTENLIQALARIVVMDQLVAVSKWWKVAFTVHDEICAVVPEKEADYALTKILEIMHTPPKWLPTWPVAAEGGYGKSYGDCK